jgi:hypothetical protein
MGLGLYEFRYPRGLHMADYPYIGDPAWRPRLFVNEPTWEIRDGAVVHLPMSPEAVLQIASTIVFAADPDARGAVAFHVLLSQTLGEEAARECWSAIKLLAFDATSVERSLDEIGSTHDAWFESIRHAGLARRFFDYNYNVNALTFFSPVLYAINQRSDRPSKSTENGFPVSKYSLQLLYALRDQPLPERPKGVLWEVFRKMQHWTGTGRYPPSPLGSPSSQAEIVRGLQRDDLMQHAELSPTGRTFLDRLHPDCCDPDLPARISNWEQAWPASRTRMERYLHTFFGKQKRFKSPR